MSARAEIQVLERGMSAPDGVRFSATALLIDEACESTFIEAGAWLQRIEGCRAWWWGDYMVAYCAWKLTRDMAESKVDGDADSQEKAQITYTTQYAEAAGVAAETLQEWKAVSLFYPPPCRQGGTMTYGHHREAMGGAGRNNLPLAQQWLARATREGWATTDLRAAIREARITALGEHEPMPVARIQELYAFSRWSRAILSRVPRMQSIEAATLRSEMEPAAKLLAALDAKIARAQAVITNGKHVD